MMRLSSHAALICLLVLAPGCSSPTRPTEVAGAGGTTVSGQASELAALTNAERHQAGLSSLAVSPVLTEAAQIHAEQMVSHGQMAHVLPGARYPTPEDRLAAVGYRWQAYGENVAFGQPGPASVLAAWMGSTGHRANILNSNFTELGTGYARDAAGRPYWVQVFGRPR